MKTTNLKKAYRADFRSHLFDYWRILMDFLFPAFCLGCKKEGSFACSSCLGKIDRLSEQVCPLCGHENWEGRVCSSCPSKNFFLNSVVAGGSFHKNPFLEKCIHAFKYDFIEDLALPLGDFLFETVKKFPFPEYVFCPIPLHPRRMRFRGFNQCELLISHLQSRYKEDFSKNFITYPLLKRIHFESPQMELSREQRLMNVDNAFQINENYCSFIEGANILLIDDVATTLATLNSCAKTLKNAGAKNVSALVLVRA